MLGSRTVINFLARLTAKSTADVEHVAPLIQAMSTMVRPYGLELITSLRPVVGDSAALYNVWESPDANAIVGAFSELRTTPEFRGLIADLDRVLRDEVMQIVMRAPHSPEPFKHDKLERPSGQPPLFVMCTLTAQSTAGTQHVFRHLADVKAHAERLGWRLAASMRPTVGRLSRSWEVWEVTDAQSAYDGLSFLHRASPHIATEVSELVEAQEHQPRSGHAVGQMR